MIKFILVLGIVILVIILGYISLMWFGGNLAGGGSSEQVVPDSVKAGESVKVSLKLSVWGGDEQIEGRYRDIFLYYSITGQDFLRSVEPKLLSQDEKSQTYEFSIPTSKNYAGEITYIFEFMFDGQINRIDGIKKIKIVN